MRQVTVLKSVLLMFAFLLLLFPVTYSLSPVYAAGATLSLSPAAGTFNQGCNFSVDILLDTGGAQTDGVDAILIYDPTRFTATVVRNGTIYPDYPGNVIDTQGGKVIVSGMASASSRYSGSGTLATVDFTVMSNAPAGVAKINLDFDPNDKTKTTDSNVAELNGSTTTDILNQVNNASYTIGTGVCPGVTPTPTPRGGGSYYSPVGGTPSAYTPTATPIPTKTPVLGDTADVNPTLILTVVGGALTLLGILGAAFL